MKLIDCHNSEYPALYYRLNRLLTVVIDKPCSFFFFFHSKYGNNENGNKNRKKKGRRI